MSDLVTVTLKMSAGLRDRLKERATAEGSSVSALLIAGAEGLLDGWLGVAETYQATIDRLTKERDQWLKVAKAAIPTSNAEGRRLARSHDPMGHSAHQSGPLLASAVPTNIEGEGAWCGLKQRGKPK